MNRKLDFPLHGSSVNIVKQCGGALSDIIDSKFGCVVTFSGVDVEAGADAAGWRKPAAIAPKKRCEYMLHGGVKVSVWKADLTFFPADAVVNPANEHLNHCGGLAQALSDAGGPKIQKESDDYIKKNGSLKTGEAVALNAGDLPNKMIIHAVGPDLSYSPSYELKKAKSLLEKAIWSIFFQAKEHQLANVAIPAISSGLFHFPLPDCADTIVSTVKCIYDKYSHQRNLPKEIFLVNNDEPTVREMERACRQKLDPHQHMSYSQAASSSTRGASRTSPPSVQIGNVLLTLKKDKIEDQKTDVIVNTASPCRNLSIGQISTAISQKAGGDIQKEVKRANMKGHIICTKSYKLPCREVYHTFCTDKSGAAAQQILYSSVCDCLWTAAANHHKSIAFPAIGTGALRFSKSESAMIMLKAVAKFAQNTQEKMEVFFVIFPSDHETFQAFESQMALFQQGASNHNIKPASLGPPEELPVSRASNPQISLHGPSEESVREAEKWLSVLLNKSSRNVKISNNFLLHFGEQDHLNLSLLTENGVSIEEFFTQGHACVEIDGRSTEDVVLAALQVEEMLCKIQKQFLSEEKQELQLLSDMKVSSDRQTEDLRLPKFTEEKRAFKSQGLWVQKVDEVKNPALEILFDLKKLQLGSSKTERMFQRIPAQFCDMIRHVGFYAEFAPPEDPKYGEGIYFAHTVEKALKLWKENNEEYLYFVEAEVLKGSSVPGKPGLILPPPVGTDPNVLYDSVSGGPDVSVVFSGYQALPKYIFICKMSRV
ncbi:protein mono-ADP-ribosyltransferase PARP9 [Kryptolebias marmoratus]|uniref:Poly(ADP-ribose) polymerase family member 9 n=1 Tax=Kryptolebias marmoratus TaxID=37003 RepID=A0A3Q3BL12_KRYMA|nr:protein mono-ADP-ribosyltransferase PARP9 [Kryptolebias marmoratus]